MSPSVPAPRLVVVPLLALVLAIRNVVYWVRRVFYAEPLFKAYCDRYGKGLHTGIRLHWVSGPGRIVLGDHVTLDGMSSFLFSTRYRERPLLEIGNRSGLGHGCALQVGDRISIGNDTRIGSYCWIMDTPGHPSDPAGRLRDEPAPAKDVRPVVIGNNVWMGAHVIVFPGVTIGDNSVIATGAVVMSDVPANTVVAGNPARRISALADPTLPPAPERSHASRLA